MCLCVCIYLSPAYSPACRLSLSLVSRDVRTGFSEKVSIWERNSENRMKLSLSQPYELRKRYLKYALFTHNNNARNFLILSALICCLTSVATDGKMMEMCEKKSKLKGEREEREGGEREREREKIATICLRSPQSY